MEKFGPASPAKSLLPEWKALERIARLASEFVEDKDEEILFGLKNAVRDYEVLKHDTTKR